VQIDTNVSNFLLKDYPRTVWLVLDYSDDATGVFSGNLLYTY
jgi:hypothetical protein